MNIAARIQEIQYVVAPAVMVSSTALLLLGLQTKFSNLASRFRALHHERRVLWLKAVRDEAEHSWLRNVQAQVEQLMRRASCVKRAILLSYAAIVCFTGTSVLLLCDVYVSFQGGRIALAVFLLGLCCVLLSALVMMFETSLFHQVLTLESAS